MLVVQIEPGLQICCLIPLSAEASSHTIYPNGYNLPGRSGRAAKLSDRWKVSIRKHKRIYLMLRSGMLCSLEWSTRECAGDNKAFFKTSQNSSFDKYFFFRQRLSSFKNHHLPVGIFSSRSHLHCRSLHEGCLLGSSHQQADSHTIETKGGRQRPSSSFQTRKKGVQAAQALSEFSPLFPCSQRSLLLYCYRE